MTAVACSMARGLDIFLVFMQDLTREAPPLGGSREALRAAVRRGRGDVQPPPLAGCVALAFFSSAVMIGLVILLFGKSIYMMRLIIEKV